MADDFLHRAMMAAFGAGTLAELYALEVALRLERAGERVYIAKSPPPQARAGALAASIAAGKAFSEAAAEVGVTERHGYRLLSRKWSP